MVGGVIGAIIWLVLFHLLLFVLNENGAFRGWWSRRKRTAFFTSNRRDTPAPVASYRDLCSSSTHILTAAAKHSQPDSRDWLGMARAAGVETLALPALQPFTAADFAAMKPAASQLLRQAGEADPTVFVTQHAHAAHALLDKQVSHKPVHTNQGAPSPPSPRVQEEASPNVRHDVEERGKTLTAKTVFVALLLAGMLRASARRPATYFAFDVHDAKHLSESRFLPPAAAAILLCCYRAAAALYCAATILVIRFAGEGLQPVFVTYFTHWNVFLLGVYGLLGAGTSARWLLRHRPDVVARFRLRGRRREGADIAALENVTVVPTPTTTTASESDAPSPSHTSTLRLRSSPLPPAPRAPPARYDFLDKAFALSLVTVATSSVFLTLVYWVQVYPSEDHSKSKVDLDNLMRHGINIVVTLGDMLLSRTPVCGYWFHAVLAYVTVYAIFFGIYASVASSPYPSLTDSGIFWKVVVLTLVLLGSFLVTYLLAALRERCWRHRGRHTREAVACSQQGAPAEKRAREQTSQNGGVVELRDSRSQGPGKGQGKLEAGVGGRQGVPGHAGYVDV